MDNTVGKLDAMFQKADSDINNLSDRLKEEFGDHEVEDLLESNPSELVQKIAGVKKEFASIIQQAEAVKQAEKEAMVEFRSHINDICQLLLKLQNTESLPTDKPEELVRLEKFLGTEIPWGQGSTSLSDTNDKTDDKTESACDNNQELTTYEKVSQT
ncbi:Spindle and kinetochore associated complex subunit 2 [Mactra antiquata]